MLKRSICFTVAAVLIMALSACGSEDESSSLPAGVGQEVWSYLQTLDYENEWNLWPGTEEMFAGKEPHGELHTVYASPRTQTAILEKAGSLPNGALVVKNNFTAEGTFSLATTMYKVEGFDPENNDWFWARVQPDGTVEAEGKLEGCQACHGTQRDNDFIWIGPLK